VYVGSCSTFRVGGEGCCPVRAVRDSGYGKRPLYKLTRILTLPTYTLKMEAEFSYETSEALPTSTRCKNVRVE
jgi:hypothetical protein